jgi:hypothetical protein
MMPSRAPAACTSSATRAMPATVSSSQSQGWNVAPREDGCTGADDIMTRPVPPRARVAR